MPSQMARAGFVYAPQQSGDDLATCLYCNISLSGWDEEDDPLYAIFNIHLHSYRDEHSLAEKNIINAQ